jgi:copper(I)-binding protein
VKKFLLALMLVPSLVISLSACAAQTSGELEVSGAWVKSSEYSDHIGGMTGAFMVITNNSNQDVTLIGGSSSFAPMIQTHQVIDGVMSEKADGITIKAGESVTLEPGGLHVMLMNLSKVIDAGTSVDLTLKFKGHADIKLNDMIAKTVPAGEETYTPMPMPEPTN